MILPESSLLLAAVGVAGLALGWALGLTFGARRQAAELRESLAALHEAADITARGQERGTEAARAALSGLDRMGERLAAMQARIGEVGDLRRLFGNVRARGGWAETQLRALLDDALPPGAYATNWRPRPDRAEAVEFALRLPSRDAEPVFLPVDAKFPVADYERLITALEAGDVPAERAARTGLDRRVREEAARIAKYLAPPATVDFAVMYVPTDGLYAEIARLPGLLDEVGRRHRVLVLGPAVLPALLRTLHLGHVTLTLERGAAEVRRLLIATRVEVARLDEVLERLQRQAGVLSGTLEDARGRVRAVGRRLDSAGEAESDTP